VSPARKGPLLAADARDELAIADLEVSSWRGWKCPGGLTSPVVHSDSTSSSSPFVSSPEVRTVTVCTSESR
jgi:hypothetical protein